MKAVYKWEDAFEWGTQQEFRVLKALATKNPHLHIKPMGGKDRPDGWSDIGGIEVKSYSGWYKYPIIEIKCMTSKKPSCWVSDAQIKLVVVNHEGWLHLYNADKLRYHNEEHNFPIWYGEISQGDGTYKRMKFITVGGRSEIQQEFTDIKLDPKRWNCKQLKEKNPYIGSYWIGK
jgi:hypothetical protein